MSAVILQDEIVHYEVLGRGRPLIFLHSWSGSWRYWIPSMQATSITFRAYAIDLWGFGDSAKNPEKYSLPAQLSLLRDFLERMGIAKIALVGHGLGATVSLQFSLENPDLVDRIMAISAPMDNLALQPRLLTSTPLELAEWLLSKVPGTDVARMEAAKADPHALAVTLQSMDTFNLESLVQRLTVPCLFVYGSNDPAVQAPNFDVLTTFPEHTHQVAFEQSGHFPMLEEDNKFQRLLIDFLSLTSGESPQRLQLKEEWKRRVR